MIVIADSSPLIALTNIGLVQILPSLFETVTIPPQVAGELAHSRRLPAVRDLIQNKPTWLDVRTPSSDEPIPLLQPAEVAAIHLATELNADLLLMDEIRGRKAALERRLKITGTIGVLEFAASRKLLDLKDAFDRLKQTDFWISHKLLEERLRLLQQPPGFGKPSQR